MASNSILVLVEGAKTDVRLVERLLKIYDLDSVFEIVSYNTNIYTLYNKMFKSGEADALDLLQTLKEHSEIDKHIFDKKYSDILLIFDLDPQDTHFDSEKITEMSEYFNESTDKGKLYLNYPMVEAFSHRYNEEDEMYMDREISIDEVKRYKQIVHSFTSDPNKLGKTKSEMDKIILQNLKKANTLIKSKEFTYYPDLLKVLDNQIDKMNKEYSLAVLCTCVFFISDYDKNLLV